ncbi:hypothetical protein SDC9_108166 [bioreactor metagenome]|uniref:Uncharacterized protein n=1 Tax=bioreactor metagenome TaxID=1076179 RepID=A0A645B8C6_9ZZZZ
MQRIALEIDLDAIHAQAVEVARAVAEPRTLGGVAIGGGFGLAEKTVAVGAGIVPWIRGLIRMRLRLAHHPSGRIEGEAYLGRGAGEGGQLAIGAPGEMLGDRRRTRGGRQVTGDETAHGVVFVTCHRRLGQAGAVSRPSGFKRL